MKNKLFYNLSHKFHRIGFYFKSVFIYIKDERKEKNKIHRFFKAFLINLKLFNYKNGYYEYLEIPLTTKCSLLCKHCSNLIPCYKRRKDYDSKILLKSIKTFLECINNIVYVRLLGGEPFLSDNLYCILKYLVKNDKIQIIEIVTNGTVVPNDKKIIKLLKNKYVRISISDYPNVDKTNLINFLVKHHINYRIDTMNYWMDYGKPFKRNKSVTQLKKQFSRCNNVCKSLVNGQLHLCPRSSHGTDLKILKNNESDYVDLLDKSFTIEEKREKINALFRKKYINACDYCDFGTKESNKIPVAEQINLNNDAK